MRGAELMVFVRSGSTRLWLSDEYLHVGSDYLITRDITRNRNMSPLT